MKYSYELDTKHIKDFQCDGVFMHPLPTKGKIVRQCIYNLVKQYHEIRNWLFDQNSLLGVLISINNAEIVALDKEGFNRILKAGDELEILAMVACG